MNVGNLMQSGGVQSADAMRVSRVLKGWKAGVIIVPRRFKRLSAKLQQPTSASRNGQSVAGSVPHRLCAKRCTKLSSESTL